MSDPPTRATLAQQLLAWITGITTLWQLLIFVLVGASLLAGTMLYQHPEWITMLLQAWVPSH